MDFKGMNTLNFIRVLNQLADREYLFSIIAYGAAPTVYGRKPSSLMTFTKNARNLYGLWSRFKNEVCKELELEFVELKDTQDSVRVLFYRRELLDECINRKECREFLKEMGYREGLGVKDCLEQLKNRFEYICPHEIGIFLGIPVEDVLGFIAYKGENSIICKYWKVYHNPKRAKALFGSYDSARAAVREAIEKLHVHKAEDNLLFTP